MILRPRSTRRVWLGATAALAAMINRPRAICAQPAGDPLDDHVYSTLAADRGRRIVVNVGNRQTQRLAAAGVERLTLAGFVPAGQWSDTLKLKTGRFFLSDDIADYERQIDSNLRIAERTGTTVLFQDIEGSNAEDIGITYSFTKNSPAQHDACIQFWNTANDGLRAEARRRGFRSLTNIQYNLPRSQGDLDFPVPQARERYAKEFARAVKALDRRMIIGSFLYLAPLRWTQAIDGNRQVFDTAFQKRVIDNYVLMYDALIRLSPAEFVWSVTLWPVLWSYSREIKHYNERHGTSYTWNYPAQQYPGAAEGWAMTGEALRYALDEFSRVGVQVFPIWAEQGDDPYSENNAAKSKWLKPVWDDWAAVLGTWMDEHRVKSLNL